MAVAKLEATKVARRSFQCSPSGVRLSWWSGLARLGSARWGTLREGWQDTPASLDWAREAVKTTAADTRLDTMQSYFNAINPSAVDLTEDGGMAPAAEQSVPSVATSCDGLAGLRLVRWVWVDAPADGYEFSVLRRPGRRANIDYRITVVFMVAQRTSRRRWTASDCACCRWAPCQDEHKSASVKVIPRLDESR
jgi:hypothetical protein